MRGGVKKVIDFEKLKKILSDEISEDKEKYEFTWVGKQASLKDAYRPIEKTLRPSIEESLDWDNTKNLYIEGDNLEALKLLQESYLGKVKLIYIDPPYNTGNDLIYMDSFKTDKDSYLSLMGTVSEDGTCLVKNTNINGRFHSDWCSMMYSRLLLARGFLKSDGAIFISIDDHEVENLKKICDEVFGEQNFVASFPWRKRTAKSDVPFGVSQDYEQIICYAKSAAFRASIEGKQRKYYETEDYPGQPWRIHDLTTQRTALERPKSNFTIINPKTGERYPANPNSTWRITEDTFEEYYRKGRIVFPGDYDFLRISKPVLRYWKIDDERKAGENFGKISVSTKFPDDIGMSQDGTKEITNLFGHKVFSYPKPVSLIKYIIKCCTKKDDIVLDFFSGSGTTAESVLQLNSEDHLDRKFIMIQIGEPCSTQLSEQDQEIETIADIGKKRIKLAGEKIKQNSVDTTDVGFRTFKIDSSNMQDIYYSPENFRQSQLNLLESNIKDDRSDLDILFGCVLDWGLPLSEKYSCEHIDHCSVHNYDNGELVACFEHNIPEKVVKEIALKEPDRVVFRDSGFPNDAARVNVDEIFKLLSPDTEIKVI